MFILTKPLSFVYIVAPLDSMLYFFLVLIVQHTASGGDHNGNNHFLPVIVDPLAFIVGFICCISLIVILYFLLMTINLTYLLTLFTLFILSKLC